MREAASSVGAVAKDNALVSLIVESEMVTLPLVGLKAHVRGRRSFWISRSRCRRQIMNRVKLIATKAHPPNALPTISRVAAVCFPVERDWVSLEVDTGAVVLVAVYIQI